MELGALQGRSRRSQLDRVPSSSHCATLETCAGVRYPPTLLYSPFACEQRTIPIRSHLADLHLVLCCSFTKALALPPSAPSDSMVYLPAPAWLSREEAIHRTLRLA